MALEATEALEVAEAHEEPQTILRDRLAAIRTDLANERTMLAYVRTGFALIVTGVTFINFFGPALVVIVGWSLIPVGLVSIIVGLARFRQMRARIEAMCPHRECLIEPVATGPRQS